MAHRELTEEEKQKIEELRDQHGAVSPMLVLDELVVVRKATQGDLDRYNDRMAKSFAPQTGRGRGSSDGASFSSAQRELAMASIVHPAEYEKKTELIRKQPGLVGTAASEAERLAQDGIVVLEGN